jgi:hypothetical protein
MHPIQVIPSLSVTGQSSSLSKANITITLQDVDALLDMWHTWQQFGEVTKEDVEHEMKESGLGNLWDMLMAAEDYGGTMNADLAEKTDDLDAEVKTNSSLSSKFASLDADNVTLKAAFLKLKAEASRERTLEEEVTVQRDEAEQGVKDWMDYCENLEKGKEETADDDGEEEVVNEEELYIADHSYPPVVAVRVDAACSPIIFGQVSRSCGPDAPLGAAITSFAAPVFALPGALQTPLGPAGPALPAPALPLSPVLVASALTASPPSAACTGTAGSAKGVLSVSIPTPVVTQFTAPTQSLGAFSTPTPSTGVAASPISTSPIFDEQFKNPFSFMETGSKESFTGKSRRKPNKYRHQHGKRARKHLERQAGEECKGSNEVVKNDDDDVAGVKAKEAIEDRT